MSNVNVFTPQTKPSVPVVKVFLAGSIDNGNAVDWQTDIISKFNKTFEGTSIQIDVFNPRIENWDTSIDPSEKSDTLIHQIVWELDHLRKADIVVMYLDSDSKSPISLMELGKHMHNNMFVFCPDSFYRSVNVHTTCEYYGTPHYTDSYEWYRDIVANISACAELLTP